MIAVQSKALVSPEEKGEQAASLFASGCNCAQAVLNSFCDELPLDEETLLALSAPFGGGIGRMREVCGAVSGMLMTIGAAHPDYSKTEIYEISRKAMDDFYEKFGTLNCAELLKDAGADDSPVPSERTPEYDASRPCEKIIGCAVEIAEKYL